MKKADLLAPGCLFALACAPFAAAIGDAGAAPSGIDLGEHYSRESVLRLALRTTAIPLWNPYEFSGFPSQADPGTGVFYPPSALLRLLPLGAFFTWTVILHVWLFGAGCYAFARMLGAGAWPSFIIGLGLMLGGITIPRVYAGHLEVLRTVAWMPLALSAAMRSIDRCTLLPSSWSVLVLALQLLAGFFQLAFYTLCAVALYAVYSVVWPANGPRSGRNGGLVATQLVVMIALAVGLTAFQLWPTAKLAAAAGRTTGVPLSSAVESSFDLRTLAPAMLAPRVGDDIPNQAWEVSAYAGWLPALAAPFALLVSKQRRSVVFLLVLAGLALALATGGPLYSLHHKWLPMFRIPGRILAFWALPIGVLGAIALDGLLRSAARMPRLGVSGARLVPFVLAGLVVLDMSAYARGFVRTEPISSRFAQSLPFTPTRFGRVVSLCEQRLHTTEITALGVPSIDGYNSYFTLGYAHLASSVAGRPISAQHISFPRIGAGRSIRDYETLSLMNVTEIIACRPIDVPGLDLLVEEPPFYVYRNTRAAGRVAAACSDDRTDSRACGDGVQINVSVADTPTGVLRFRVAQQAPHLLWLAEPYFHERRAWVDGVETPIVKAHVALSAIHVGAGLHQVELKFVPTTLFKGTIVSIATAVLWILASSARRRLGT